MVWNDGRIVISGGDINLGGYDFETSNYQPPSYGRAVSFTDVPQDFLETDGTTVITRMQRTADDLGPQMGNWNTFDVHCYNSDNYDQGDQKGRGELMYQNLLTVFSLVGQPILLKDNWSDKEFWVMFDASGLIVKYAAPTRAAGVDPETLEPLGPEYDVSITLLEVPAPIEEEIE